MKTQAEILGLNPGEWPYLLFPDRDRPEIPWIWETLGLLGEEGE